MSKIKSITITQPLKATFYATTITKIEKDGNGFCIIGDNLEMFIRPTSVENVEYEPEPAKKEQIFYPNGACVRPLETGQKYWYLYHKNTIRSYDWDGGETDFAILQSQNVFLTYEAAEKAKQVKDNHNWILAKVMEINAEHSDEEKMYFVCWRNNRKAFYLFQDYSLESTKMTEQAKDWLMSDNVSDQDFKHFLFIYE